MTDDPEGIRSRLRRLTDKEVRSYMTFGGDGPFHSIAVEVLAERESERVRVEALAEEDRVAHLNLSERSVRAAETQATYAKRAYDRANVAIGVSIAAIVVTAFFAMLDFLKP